MIFAIRCVDAPDSAAVREATRQPHIDYLKANDHCIVLAGATLTDDGTAQTGSQFIINVADRAAAEAFSAGDPFTTAGLFASVEITRMRKGFWHPETIDRD